MENTCDIIVGLQHGDEGKGKVAHALLKKNEYDYCIRYNGGPNAGHTIQITPVKSITLHQLPCGVLHNVPSIIGTNCVIDLAKLEEEIVQVENALPELRGLIKENLYLAHNAHIICDSHIEYDMRLNSGIGTTNCGIGPCYASKINRTGMRIEHSNTEFKTLNIYEHFQNKETTSHILFEGAQGFQLDIDWGEYPYVTSSVVNSYGIYSCGIPKIKIIDIIGCAKLYDTYVGNKQFQPIGNDVLELIAVQGKEEGSTTGRKRQIDWLNLYKLKKAILINNCNYIVINKCDIIQQISDAVEADSVFIVYENNIVHTFCNLEEMKNYIYTFITEIDKTTNINILFSESAFEV